MLAAQEPSQAEIDDGLSMLVPADILVLLISGGASGSIGSRLSEGRSLYELVSGGDLDLLREGLTIRPDVAFCVIRDSLDSFDNPQALLSALAKAGLPSVCRIASAAGTALDEDALRGLTREAGFRIVATTIPAAGMKAFLLMPTAHVVNLDWWASRDGIRFVKRRQKRGERMQDASVVASGAAVWRPSPKWEARSVAVADLIPDDLHVLDVGCGTMFLEQHLRMRRYVPLDRFAHDDRTIVCDMNRDLVPMEAIAEADLVTALGVFEYIEDPGRQFRLVAAAGKPLLITYNVAELRKRTAEDNQLTEWRNDWTTAQFTQLLLASGFNLERLVDFGDRQRIFVAMPRHGARQAWWDGLGVPKQAAGAAGQPAR